MLIFCLFVIVYFDTFKLIDFIGVKTYYAAINQ